MFVVGLGGSVHDYSACLVEDGRVVNAISEERVTRKKHGLGVNLLFEGARKYCVEAAGIRLDDVEAVFATDILAPVAYHGCRKKVHLINHHLAHASSAFFPSMTSDAAILVVDGAGSVINSVETPDPEVEYVETVSYWTGHGTDLTCIGRVVGRRFDGAERTENSIGEFYCLGTERLGFGEFDEGKTMALAAWGSHRYLNVFEHLLHLESDGQIVITRRDLQLLREAIDGILDSSNGQDEVFKAKADIAAAMQHVTEQALMHCVNHLRRGCNARTLCFAGGVALNSVANGKILTRGPFERLYIQPAAGDDGTALGCAIYGYSRMEPEARHLAQNTSVYLGRSYTEDELLAALSEWAEDLEWERTEHIAERTADVLARGEVVGWFQGRSEWGPRALGNRSILADPRSTAIKDRINARIKGREWFQPLAAVTTIEDAPQHFRPAIESPHMLLVTGFVTPAKKKFGGVVHADGSVRLQTVRAQDNLLLHELLVAVKALIGCAVLINTSFNGPGEPIVESPADAVRCFLARGIDKLVLGPFIVSRKVAGG